VFLPALMEDIETVKNAENAILHVLLAKITNHALPANLNSSPTTKANVFLHALLEKSLFSTPVLLVKTLNA
jgi:hypothetical protein